jgi:inosine/xanthosine triphosphate pyrophosphatase family protein
MAEIEKMVIATRNPGKINFYRQIFESVVDEVISLTDLNIQGTPEESGNTAEENAIIKANYYGSQTDLPIFCEDEALYVDFLDKDHQPGTHVRRINGVDEVTDDELFDYWENIIKDLSPEERTGFWRFAYAIFQNGKIKIATNDHPIRFHYPASTNRIPGYPMSSLQGSIDLGKPSSDRTTEEKEESVKGSAPIILNILKELLNSESNS